MRGLGCNYGHGFRDYTSSGFRIWGSGSVVRLGFRDRG